MTARIEISLFGTCTVRVIAQQTYEIRGAKHRALFAMLASAPLGVLTRKFLQNTLWGYAGYDSGHQNLRRALSSLRKSLGQSFEQLLHTTNSDVELDLERVDFIGNTAAGRFLGDINLNHSSFIDWVQTIRSNPQQIAALYRVKQRAPRIRSRLRVTALPLCSMASDPELSILGDWIAEEICRSLSKSCFLTVISHLSSRAVIKREIDLINVREMLDVDYLITGTLRREKHQLIANFDLITTSSGETQWLGEVHCQDHHISGPFLECLVGIIRSIGHAIINETINYVRDRAMPLIEDHKLMIAGVSMMHRQKMKYFLESRKYLEEAARRMPNLSDTHAWLSNWYVLSVLNGFAVNRQQETIKALSESAKALNIDPESSLSLTIDGFVHNNLLKDMSTAEQRYREALNINANESLAWLLRGTLMAFQDDGIAAIRATEKARCLSPIDPFGYYYDSLTSTAHLAAEDYEQALKYANRSLGLNDRHTSTLRAKITALYFLGREDEACTTANTLLLRQPNFKLEEYRHNHPSAEYKLGLRVIEALTASGIT